MKTIADLAERLRVLHGWTADTPLFNPVFQLSLEISRAIEADALTLEDIEAMVRSLEADGLRARADRLVKLVGPVDGRPSVPPDLDDFTRWSTPIAHVVFTAHPTFMLSAHQATVVASLARGTAVDPPVDSASVAPSLDFEHDAAMAAATHGQDARTRIAKTLLQSARQRWPVEWRHCRPQPFRFGTWVGYDMDGRTDIAWHTCLRFRLAEKAMRLRRYVDALQGLVPQVVERLERAARFAESLSAQFGGELTAPEALSRVADELATEHDDKLVSLRPIVSILEKAVAEAGEVDAERLILVICDMHSDGLGMGEVHFRVNNSQLQNAIRRRISGDGQFDLSSQAALVRMRELLATVTPLRSNLAALAIENSTAIRQFLLMSQILRHIDADAPIRLLVAECEQPTTVLAALYFAELFDVADKVDVSPLFETESALEHSGRFLEVLLGESGYQRHIRRRGRLAIQTGFSDAGRFVGQIPAALAIERLQGRLAEVMAEHGLTDVSALIFNTHGESMGRGAHPASFADRIEWPLSPWARRQFARAGIKIEAEVSFQGGDGYLFFGSAELALATLSRLIEHAPIRCDPQAPADPFYQRTDLSLDFYRAIRRVQQQHMASTTYSRAVTSFGLGLLGDTGSRKSRRQSDLIADRQQSLRQIRAIPHNAILQQLGYPVNVLSGFGTAAREAVEELADLLRNSARGRQLVRFIRGANAVASIKTVAAYGELFNSAYWATRTYRGAEQPIAAQCLALAEYFTKDDRAGVFRRLASRLRVDALRLHDLLTRLPQDEIATDRERVRRSLGILHALRLALMQHMFLRVVAIPAFSRANDIAREDVWEMVFSLRIEEALSQLRRAFPTGQRSIDDFHLREPTDYPDAESPDYDAIRTQFIDPIDRAWRVSRRISTVIANRFGAFG
jgi:phosphoenolpyruvate carboxylase